MKIALTFLLSAIFFIIFYISYYLYNDPLSFSTIQVNTTTIPLEDIKTLVLNLDNSTSRYQKITEQLKNTNLNYERFSAIDGYNLIIINNNTGEKFKGKELKYNPYLFLEDNYYTIKCPNDDITYYYKPAIYPRPLSAGEFGCYCSHRAIWLKILKENTPYTLILEDDAQFNEDFNQKFSSLLSAVPVNWDILYLGANIYTGRILYNINNHQLLKKIVMNKTKQLYGMHAYMINQSSVKNLLQYSKTFSSPIDAIFYEAITEKHFNRYLTWPCLIKINHSAPSEIDDRSYFNSKLRDTWKLNIK